MNDDLMKALAESVAELNQFTAMLNFTSEAAEATDESGAVTVSMDDKQRVTQIRVASGWQDKVPPEQLATAVQQAVGNAMVKSFGGSEEDGADAARPSGTPEVTREDEQTAQRLVDQQSQMLQEAVEHQSIEELTEQIFQTAEGFESTQANEGETEADSLQAREYFNASKRASLVYEAGFLSEVRLDKNWVRGQSGTALTAAFTEILEQAAGERSGLDSAAEMFSSFKF